MTVHFEGTYVGHADRSRSIMQSEPRWGHGQLQLAAYQKDLKMLLPDELWIVAEPLPKGAGRGALARGVLAHFVRQVRGSMHFMAGRLHDGAIRCSTECNSSTVSTMSFVRCERKTEAQDPSCSIAA